MKYFDSINNNISEIEHSENKVNAYFENEVGPGMLQSSIKETFILKEIQTTRIESIATNTCSQWPKTADLSILAARWTGEIRVQPRFLTAKIV